MAIARKAVAEDFESVFPLLQNLNPRITRENWQKVFLNQWRSTEDHFGYLLEEEGRVVGFLGYLFSQRTIRGRTEKFCNVTSWAVEDNFRAKSLMLLYPLLKLSGYTLTNFTAADLRVNRIFKKLGFLVLDDRSVILYPVPSVNGIFRQRVELVYDHRLLRKCLKGKDLEIFTDHAAFECTHLLIRSKEGDCYLVLAKSARKNIPVLSIQYLSEPELFHRCINSVLPKILWKQRRWVLQIDKRLLKGVTIPNSVTISSGCERLYKSDHLNREDVDSLYSELFLLGIYI